MHLEHYKYLKEHPGIKFGVPSVDRYVLPQRPGDMTVICGRPGHGKSSLLARQAKRTAQDIAARGAQYEECVMYVSWEQHAEELEAYFQADDAYTVSDYAWGRVDLADVQAKADRRAALPLWMVGHSRRNVSGQTQPMTLGVVFQAIESMAHTFREAPKPALLCFDYAQLIPYERGHKNRYEQVKAAIVATKQLALRVGCPVLIAAQAGRQVDSYRYPIPGQNDGQESSGLEQAPDKFFGIWRPWKTHRTEAEIELPGGHVVPNSPELFILRMSKQRNADGERTWVLSFDMAELRLAEMEIRREEF
jgi:replicative DNA helicase